MSRKPFQLRQREDGIVLHPAGTRTFIAIDGSEVTRPRMLSNEELDRGVFIELAGRIALLLDRQLPYFEQDNDDLGMIGHSPAIRQIRDEVRRVAGHDAAILIRGETGVGKERVAQAIHARSHRCRRALVSVNAATLWPSIATAALFGAKSGAFTGATQDQSGYFKRADRGTLFLDEIGELPADVQPMLLRVLDTLEIIPVGGKRAEVVDVRLITATDADLGAMVVEGRFREPLLFRLAGYEIVVPPLRERRCDIGMLMMHFLAQELDAVGARDLLQTKADSQPWLPFELALRFLRYDWPGNVRELRRAVASLVMASHDRPMAYLPPAWDRTLNGSSKLVMGAVGDMMLRDRRLVMPGRDDAGSEPPRTGRAPAISHEALLAAMRDHRYEIKATADYLGIARNTLYKRIDESSVLRRGREIPREEMRQCLKACSGDFDAMSERLLISSRAVKQRLKDLGLESYDGDENSGDGDKSV